jgi:hypothetical protein
MWRTWGGFVVTVVRVKAEAVDKIHVAATTIEESKTFIVNLVIMIHCEIESESIGDLTA